MKKIRPEPGQKISGENSRAKNPAQRGPRSRRRPAVARRKPVHRNGNHVKKFPARAAARPGRDDEASVHQDDRSRPHRAAICAGRDVRGHSCRPPADERAGLTTASSRATAASTGNPNTAESTGRVRVVKSALIVFPTIFTATCAPSQPSPSPEHLPASPMTAASAPATLLGCLSAK